IRPRDVSKTFPGALRARPRGVQTIEYWLTIDGEPRDFEARLVPSGDDEVVVIVRDFTDRIRLGQEAARRLASIQREQEFTRALVNVAPVIFLLVDPEGRIVRFNDHTERLFGMKDNDKVRGRKWWDVFLPEENRPAAQGFCWQMNAGADQLTDESEWQAGRGAPRTVHFTSFSFFVT